MKGTKICFKCKKEFSPIAEIVIRNFTKPLGIKIIQESNYKDFCAVSV